LYWINEAPRLARAGLGAMLLGGAAGLVAGTASALFLFSLDWATQTQESRPWLLFLLPLAGALIGYLYDRYGQDAVKGNNLIIAVLNGEEKRIPFRMAPFVLIGTITTHLFGGSAGREGTAVQMGGSLADAMARLFRLDARTRRLLLAGGVSAGFGSVFGTPLAGMIFGLEVAQVGLLRYDALLACLVGAYVGDWTTTAWGAHHTHYHVTSPIPTMTPLLAGKLLLAAIAFGLTARLFWRLTHGIKGVLQQKVPRAWLRPVIGGLAVIGLTLLLGTRIYNGLGVPVIRQAVSTGFVPHFAFLAKLVLTAVTVGSGFQGGEVTPLFFMGATLGHTLATPLGLPVDYLAALGFVATFGAAANAPLASLLMGIELFGAGALTAPLVITCAFAFFASGRGGIYTTQEWALEK
jgi:H+/Cl- antiporter ClcA